jgi:hypothetical protein
LGLALAAVLGGGWVPAVLLGIMTLAAVLVLDRWLKRSGHPWRALPADLLTDFAMLVGYFAGKRRRKP